MLDKEVPTSGADAGLAPDTDIITLEAGSTASFMVPASAKYLYVYLGTGNYTPQAVTLYRTIAEQATDRRDLALTAAEGKMLFNMAAVPRVIDVQSLPMKQGRILDTGLWNNTARYKHVIIPVSVGEYVLFTANATNTTYYAFLAGYPTPVNGEPAVLVPNTSRVTVSAGATVQFTVPAGTI